MRESAMRCEPGSASSTRTPLAALPWPLSDDELEHAAVKAWAQLGRDRVPTAVEPLQKKRKGCVYRLRGAAPDGADVIGKRSTPERIARERAIYEHILPLLQVSTVRYHGFVAETEREACWIRRRCASC